MRNRTDWLATGFAALAVTAVLVFVDLSPRVESEFFFSEEDPQLKATVEIARQFPAPDQLVIRAAAPDLQSEAYRSAIEDLGRRLSEIPGVAAVYSVANQDRRSPLWGRLLLNPDSASANLILQVDAADPAALVRGVEAAVRETEAPDVDLDVSGVPYVIELIRRSLFRDFVIFSSAALLVFGLVLRIVYRRWSTVIGTLTACLTACAVTLGLTDLLGIHIGLLTANIVTIVFVLTLSHTVFLTSNWKRTAADGRDRAVLRAIRVTLEASVWCAATTLLGFLSLLLASARPLRELGLAGAIGTVTALVVAFGVYPAFLRGAISANDGGGWWKTVDVGRFLPTADRRYWLAALGLVAVVLVPGVFRLQTDPSLLSYFAAGTELRDGLEAIDRDGGSSNLNLVVRPASGERVDTDAAIEAMWALQDSLEADPAVGVTLSPAVILAHARQQPLAGLLGSSQLLDIMEQPLFGRIALAFVTAERDRGLFAARMRESARDEPRAAAVARLEGYARASGLEVMTTGGVYELQGQLGRLIARSLRFGLGGLLVLFVGIAFVVSRAVPVTGAMVLWLTAIPVVVLGVMGYLQLPVDMITSPAANVALAMGVDSMIHLVTRARRLRHTGVEGGREWLEARGQLWAPILGATLIICAGFGIFSLSAFPPTQRFGIAVILGTLTAATVTLVALPLTVSREP